jgi:hypothetical protein
MTPAPPTIVPIFATPFAIVPLAGEADLNAALAALFLSRATEEYRDPESARDALCFRSRENLFEWPQEAVQRLRREMLGGICAAVMAVNRSTEAEFDALGVQARARFAIVRPNGSIPAATAPLASWYAFYCVAAPPPTVARVDSGVLRLYAIRDASMFLDAANYRLREPFTGAHHVWRPVAGEMVVFPASILHEVALNRTEASILLVSARARFSHGGEGQLPPW